MISLTGFVSSVVKILSESPGFVSLDPHGGRAVVVVGQHVVVVNVQT